ncbi:MAG TPA: hypothetical protein VGP41_09710 [Candidatus Lustribacter sp.]|jgi:hypothetical protein|nr:hypothetical protein [Candidatus Lustribacter sp.]
MLDQNARAQVGMIYRDHLIASLGYNIKNCSSAEEIITLARNLYSPDYEAGQGWRTDPPFPGAHDEPLSIPPHWRMVTACRLLDRDDQELGVFYVTFVSGKPTAVVLSPAGTEIPNHYVPLKAPFK